MALIRLSRQIDGRPRCDERLTLAPISGQRGKALFKVTEPINAPVPFTTVVEHGARVMFELAALSGARLDRHARFLGCDHTVIRRQMLQCRAVASPHCLAHSQHHARKINRRLRRQNAGRQLFYEFVSWLCLV